MPYRRSRARTTNKSDKHEITWSNIGQNASVAQIQTLAVSVPVGDKDASTEVAVGSHVRGVYIEFQFSAETITSTKIIHWEVGVAITGQTLSVPTLYYQNDRSQVLKRGMEMLPKDVATVIKRIIFVPIPPKFQRFAEGNVLFLSYQASSTETINACGFAIYKERY